MRLLPQKWKGLEKENLYHNFFEYCHCQIIKKPYRWYMFISLHPTL